jgi:DNA-binding transcriptional MerR regulator
VQALKPAAPAVEDVRSNAPRLRFARDGGDVSGIRTNAAAELLGVSPNTLRSWERRFGYPKPRRTQGGHRQYDLTQLEALRRALLETHNISSAIEVARQRGEGPSSPTRLLDAFDRFDESAADRVVEESLAVRSVERTVEEVLLPAVDAAQDRDGREAEYELACRWATGWLYAARRVVAPASRSQGVLIFDSSDRLDLEALHVQALELGLRRAGFRTLLLAFDLPPERVVRAMRALDPTAFVFCGGEATLEVVGRLVYTVRQVGSAAPVFEYRESMPVTGEHAIPSLGSMPTDAAERLKAYADSGRIEQVLVVPEAQKAEPSRRGASAGGVRRHA